MTPGRIAEAAATPRAGPHVRRADATGPPRWRGSCAATSASPASSALVRIRKLEAAGATRRCRDRCSLAAFDQEILDERSPAMEDTTTAAAGF